MPRGGISSVSTLVAVLVKITSDGGYGGVGTDDSDVEPFPALDDDETYTLTIPGDSSETLHSSGGQESGLLTAPTVWGALRGLETLAQLFDRIQTSPGVSHAHDTRAKTHSLYFGTEDEEEDDSVLVIRHAPVAITDSPRYPWRGLLLDTANHFLPLATLRTFLDAMSSVKMNVLHWHIVDSYSFPFQSESFPDLSAYAAWHPTRAVYSPSDVSAIVDYAADRGIRVVPEVDMPGHAYSWGLSPALQNVTARCPSFANGLGHVNDVPLDPSQELTFEVVGGVLNDASEVFPDAFFHLGGDEVQYGCWNESASVLAYMEEQGLLGDRSEEDFRALEDVFWAQALALLNNPSTKSMKKRSGSGREKDLKEKDPKEREEEEEGRPVVVWEEVFFTSDDDEDDDAVDGEWRDSPVFHPNSTVVESWTGPAFLQTVTEKGYDAILAYGWYLDRQTPVDDSTTWFWQDSWAQMYLVEPEPISEDEDEDEKGEEEEDALDRLTAAAEERHKQQQQQQQQQQQEHKQEERVGRVLGGEASLWSEQVDPLNALAQAWPRAAAVAERLWSPRETGRGVGAEAAPTPTSGGGGGGGGASSRSSSVGAGARGDSKRRREERKAPSDLPATRSRGGRSEAAAKRGVRATTLALESQGLSDAARRLGALRCRLVAWHNLPSAPTWSDFCSAAYESKY